MSSWWCERAWLDGGRWADSVAIEVEAGRITEITESTSPGSANRLAGLTIPGLANCHSHAFHRSLRGRTQRGQGTFWTWRTDMYSVAERLDPDVYFDLARAVYAEMVSVGIVAVGEFHYLHHGASGRTYDDPNAMGHALVAAAMDAGLRITLLDTCYLAAGFGRPPEGVQERFSDGDAMRWAERAEALHAHYAGDDSVVVGAAIHSVRAVPVEQLGVVAEWSRAHAAPLHMHLSEQPAENDECLSAHGVTPTRLLSDNAALGPFASAVHATHLTTNDVWLLGGSGTHACLCPTTERDLADGVGPARRLTEAGSPLTLGSDSHAVVDMFEEMRAVELDERLVSGRRGTWTAAELMTAGTAVGHRSLGFSDAGVIAVGARADLVAISTRSERTAGTGGGCETVVFAAGGADVTDVVVGGRHRVQAGGHGRSREVADALHAAIAQVTTV